ncbi:DUF4347 domain-containing protein, partial [Acaryochloris sp. IP29b_bin.137]|uniref:DUF4347 domain-containing protein n=1 Tax=Acaryochloris sp. IP29b_bin.137 TaxID=2969217 RepID=UPI002613F276
MLSTTQSSTLLTKSRSTKRTLVIIDSHIDDLPQLVNSLPQEDVIVLDPNRDGVKQITLALQEYDSLSSLHLVSHGTPGCLQLGNTKLSVETLGHYEAQLTSWSEQLDGIDVLIYGCHVAQGVLGSLFLQQMHQLTGANIAASTKRIGLVDGTPNWVLDARYGEVQSEVIFSSALQQSYTGSFVEVSFDIEQEVAIETEETEVTFRFTLDEPPPAGGVVVVLSANETSSFNRFNPGFLAANLQLDGIDQFLPGNDVSQDLDFSAFALNITAQTASFTIPVLNTPNDVSVDNPNTNPDIEDVADVAEEITWTISTISQADATTLGLGTPGTIAAGASSDTIIMADNPEQVTPAVPTVSIEGTPTLIIEDEGTVATIELTLSEAAPAGGLGVSVGTDAFRGLSDFEAFTPTTIENIIGLDGFLDDTVNGNQNNGAVVIIAPGATSATIAFSVFDDNDIPTGEQGNNVNSDIGIDNQTWTLDPQLAINGGRETDLGEYNIDPNAGTFSWTILDTRGQLNAPVATDDDGNTPENQALSGNVLTNDTDADAGETLSVSAVNGEAANVDQQITLASGALLTVNADGSYDYNPNGAFDALNDGETATDSFEYTVTDGNQVSEGVFNEDTGTVNITINGVGAANSAPDAVDDSFTINENTVLTDSVSGNDIDTEGDAT